MKVKFVCSMCGEESWFEVSPDYVVKAEDLVCDACIPIDDNQEFYINSRMVLI
jgi:hypothetical protein